MRSNCLTSSTIGALSLAASATASFSRWLLYSRPPTAITFMPGANPALNAGLSQITSPTVPLSSTVAPSE
ncbi:hypothetical protein G6F63_017002 [Rhizopus arrhizus]|nr:hypothetical protein G6F63_017002 [Rhizopus arrhizus]